MNSTQPLRFLALIPAAAASAIPRPQMCAMPTSKQLSQVLSHAKNLGSSLHIWNMLTFQQGFSKRAKSTPTQKKEKDFKNYMQYKTNNKEQKFNIFTNTEPLISFFSSATRLLVSWVLQCELICQHFICSADQLLLLHRISIFRKCVGNFLSIILPFLSSLSTYF